MKISTLSLLSIIGFVPTENGYVHTQPTQVIYYLKTTFAVIPMILCPIVKDSKQGIYNYTLK